VGRDWGLTVGGGGNRRRGSAGGGSSPGDTPRVPSVGGESRAIALTALNRAGFDKVTVSQVNDENVPKGAVIGTGRAATAGPATRQDHPADLARPEALHAARRARQVRERCHEGAREAVPEVTSTQHFDASVRRIGHRHRSTGRSERFRATPRDLIVSSGPQMLDVPDVTGNDQNDATNTVRNAASGQHRRSSSVTASTRARSSPRIRKAPRSWRKGRTVTLPSRRVRRRLPCRQPGGSSVADARKALQEAGLKSRCSGFSAAGGGDSGQVFQAAHRSGTDVAPRRHDHAYVI